MTAEGTGAAVEVAATLAMAPADSSGDNGGGRQEWRRQTETEAVAGTDTNQPESSNDCSGNGDCGGDGGDGDSGSRDGDSGGANSGQGGDRYGGRGGGMRCRPRRSVQSR